MKMNKSEKYNFSDFTLSNYRYLLRLAKEKYEFCTYEDYYKFSNFILWRHDIDYSVDSAYKLAQIEAEEKIETTYCVLLHSEFYNLFEYENTKLLKAIISLGHNIGLHFDANYYKINNVELLNKYLLYEKKIIEDILEIDLKVLSFHNPTLFFLSCDAPKYAGIVNSYSKYFRQEVGYCSDSNGFWRFRRLEEVLANFQDNCLQVLTHPVWWQEKIMSPQERIWRSIDDRSQKCKKFYIDLLENNGRKNIT